MNRIATQRAAARPALREAALAVSLALLAWPALAQEAATEPAKEKGQLETVTITAERRIENIKEVPNAVTKISGEKLDVLNSSGQDVRFLSGRVPSLNIESSFGRAFPRFYIRGYGNTDFRLNASQPVSLVYDDVVQENPILKGFPAFDLAAIEVVAGPQGTLYGRNTPAGVVKFDSVKPSQRQEGYLNLSYGTYGTTNLEGAANVPLTGDWSARISAQIQHRDDWVKNEVPAGKTGKIEGYDDRAIRLQALYEPHKDFSALFNFHGRDLTGSARLFRSSIIKPGTNDLVDGFDPEKAYTDGVNEQRLHASGGSARLRWGLGGAFNLYSITGYESVRPFSRGDVDGGYIYGGTKPYTQEGQAGFPAESSSSMSGHRQISQEFRLESATPGPLRWQAGLYFFDERYTARSTDYTTSTGLAAGYVDTYQKNTAWAAFGSVNYAVTKEFNVRGGLRFTHDKKDVNVTSSYADLNTSTGVSANTSDSKWNWDLSGTYAITKDTNLYARVATGFRASSVQGAGRFAGQSQATPENVTSYEMGVKSDFWDRRARLSASVFDYTVKDLQLTAVGGQNNANRLLNAKKATGNGVELNLELLPIDQLLITVGGSLNNTKIRDASLSLPACGGGCTMTDPLVPGSSNYSIDGNPLPNAPKWVGNLTARYSIPTAAGNEFYIYTDWAYRSKVNFFLYEAKEFTGKAMTEGGLRVGYVWNNGKYEVATYVRNITNQIRITGAIDFNNNTGFINDPRTYGVQFKSIF